MTECFQTSEVGPSVGVGVVGGILVSLVSKVWIKSLLNVTFLCLSHKETRQQAGVLIKPVWGI